MPGSLGSRTTQLPSNIGALTIRIGFGGVFYCNHNKEAPK